MPIITQLNATKLRSLKYGNDTSDGGNSGQPYIKTELKDLDKPLTRVRLTKFDDGLIRGGAIGALNASIVDTIRIGKFFKDLPKGPLFLAKQVGLQLSNPKLETKKGLGGLLGSTRLYNLGINTLRQIPITAFGGHLTRHGLFPVTDDSIKYIKVVAENNKNSDNNRLVSLANKFTLGDQIGGVGEEFSLREERRENRAANREGRQANRAANREGRQANRAANRERRQANRATNQLLRQYSEENGGGFFREKFIRTDFDRTDFKRNKLDVKSLLEQFTIDSYNGGPNSLYGIGRTTINRYAFTDDKRKIRDALTESEFQTILGSISVNPLTERSRFIKESYTDEDENEIRKWIVGKTSTPISPSFPLNNVKEASQFDAFARDPGTKFFYGTTVSTSKLQNDIGNGKISVVEGIKATPAKTILRDALPDKFVVLKNQKEDTDYIGGTRLIQIQQETPASSGVEQITNFNIGTGDKQFFGKTQAEAEAQLSDWDKEIHELDELVVRSGKPGISKSVKASIVDVSKMEGNLEKVFQNNEMTSTSEAEAFKLTDVSINRQNKKGFYFNGNNTIPTFDRIDRDIMLVSFDTIDPFTAANARNVVFSAYLSGFKYNSNSTWNPVKYVGRSESFYTFTEHKRDVSFNIQVPCFNKTHLFEKHRALSELQSAGAGQYDSNNRLGGIITKVTLGNYLVAEPGILTSISFDIPDVSSWDIDEKLAMYINAQFSFTIIGKELPTYKEGGFLNYLPNPITGTGYLTGAQAR
jgi:hypothetical protein